MTNNDLRLKRTKIKQDKKTGSLEGFETSNFKIEANFYQGGLEEIFLWLSYPTTAYDGPCCIFILTLLALTLLRDVVWVGGDGSII